MMLTAIGLSFAAAKVIYLPLRFDEELLFGSEYRVAFVVFCKIACAGQAL